MYDNIENTSVAAQKELYADPGDAVIDVYGDSKNAGKTREQIIDDMIQKINDLWPARVSKHCVPENEYSSLNVIDISAGSISDHIAFLYQLTVAQNNDIITFIDEVSLNGCYHIEVPQP